MHASQAGQRFEIHRRIAHGQIRTLDQRQTELSGEKDVFEIGLVEWTWRENDRQRIVFACQHLLAKCAEETVEGAHLKLAQRVWKHTFDDLAILERIARAGGRLRTIGQYPPSSVG